METEVEINVELWCKRNRTKFTSLTGKNTDFVPTRFISVLPMKEKREHKFNLLLLLSVVIYKMCIQSKEMLSLFRAKSLPLI